MNEISKMQELSSLFRDIQSEYAILFEKQDRQIYKQQHNKSFVDMCNIMERACECMPWRNIREITVDKGQSGFCGDWSYHVTGCCSADLTLYHTKNGLQLDIQQYGDKYKIMDCQKVLASFADSIETMRAIAYFMETGLPTPSLTWIPDPTVYGWPKDEEEV